MHGHAQGREAPLRGELPARGAEHGGRPITSSSTTITNVTSIIDNNNNNT